MMYIKLALSALLFNEVAASIVCNNCSGDCVAQPNNPHNAQDDHCAPCAMGQAWWPCDRSDLCQCNGKTVQEPEPEIVPCTTACSSCVAQANNPHNASDAHCAPCANGQAWWPCDNAALCQCADSVDPVIPVTEAPVTEAPVTEAPVTEAPVTEAPATEAPITEAPVTEAPVTEAPVTEAPVTEAPTTQAPTTTKNSHELIKGYYMIPWKNRDVAYDGPADTNVGVYWSGWGNIGRDFQKMPDGTMEALGDEAWFSLGSGFLSEQIVQDYVNGLGKLKKKGFSGVIWNLRRISGSASKWNPIFSAAFAAVKAAGFKNAITVHHSAPYKTDTPQDGTDFITAFLQDPNVDIISPTLFTENPRTVTQPEYAATDNCSPGCGWELYRNRRTGMRIVPTILQADQYEEVAAHFLDNEQLETSGYFVWHKSDRRLDPIIV